MNLTPLSIAIPLGTALLLAVVNRHVPRIVAELLSILAALGAFAVDLLLLRQSLREPIVYWFGGWTPRGSIAIGIDFYVDPVASGLAAFSSLLLTAALVYSIRYLEEEGTLFHVLMLGFLGGMSGFALSGDLFDMFVFFEIMSATAFALCAYKVEDSSALQGAFNFAITNTVAAFLGLLGIGLVYARTGALNLAQLGVALAGSHQVLVVLGFVFIVSAFLVKGAVVPFHFWLADAHAVAPTPVCILFSGVMVELGIYAVARIYWASFDPAFGSGRILVGNTMLALGGVTTVVGALMSFGQRNLKRLLAFSTISHVGILLIGFGLMSPEGFAGAAVYTVGHGLIKGALFLNAGVLLHRLNSVDEIELKGKGKKLWPTAIFFLIGALALAGAPPFTDAFGEHMISTAAEKIQFGWLGYFILFAEVLTAAAILRATGRIFLGWGRQESGNRSAKPVKESSETKGNKGHTPVWMLAPQLALFLLAAILPFLPGTLSASQNSAQKFLSSSTYAQNVLTGSAIQVTEGNNVPTLLSTLPHSLLSTLLAVILAGFALSPYWPSQKSPLRRLELPIHYVRKLHSGHIGDYVAILMLGVAVIGGALVIAIR